MDQYKLNTTDTQRLRREAEWQLASGTASGGTWTVSPQALSRLYRLASDPETASDAQALLQELQAHQVELDLQKNQMAEDARACAETCDQYRMLFEAAPVAYLVLYPGGMLRQANRRAAHCLGAAPEELLLGRHLDRFLEPVGEGSLHNLVEQALAGDDTLRTTVRCRAATAPAATLTLAAVAAPGREAVLVTLEEGA